MNRTLTVVLAAVLVVLAGCSGTVPGGPGGASPSAGDSPGTGDESTTSASTAGTVNFYVSDEPNAIDDFEHLNVTITKVGFHDATGDSEPAESTETEDDAETETAESTETETAEPTETDADGETETETAESTETETDGETETETAESTEDETETETEGDDGHEDEDEDEDDRGDWREFDVDSKTVDLTELKGNNATLVGQFELENGTYDKVFVYISDVNGTLKNGEQVHVKLPSERLHINEQFTVEANGSVDFVYDITVFEAGKSGKYILKPVVSESGTDVLIEETDEDDGEDDETDSSQGDLEAHFEGQVEPGSSATVTVTRQGQPVENATVSVDGTEYQTSADGTVTFDVPEDAKELEVTVEYDDEEVELRRTFDGGGTPEDDEREDDERATATSTSTATPTPTES